MTKPFDTSNHTAEEALELINLATNDLRLNRNEHVAIQAAINTISAALGTNPRPTKPPVDPPPTTE